LTGDEAKLKLTPTNRFREGPMVRVLLVCLGLVLVCPAAAQNAAAETGAPGRAAALLRAYPDFLERIEGNELVWRDGTRMVIDDGKGLKPFEAMLDHPDIKDMFAIPYPRGDQGLAPGVDVDPGRVRYMPLFLKMYGDCRQSNGLKDPGTVVWLRKTSGKTLQITRINGAAAALQRVSDELDALPGSFTKYLVPPAGTYNCRPIAGTNRLSGHGLGIAVDISTKHSHYWRWARKDASGRTIYKNDIPLEIVRIFEKHGFIWGGKWYHFDTMHFEYRPELIAAAPD
jgi:hypothetical protein